tara:strand:- start:4317 stop:5060 length:744 start_codon:yes stop_codon:yes gene_type:complete
VKKENPLISLAFNIFIPVLILKNGLEWIEKFLDQLGEDSWIYSKIILFDAPSFVFAIALMFPFFYFIIDFFNRKNINLISIFGFINILLTGGIGVFGAALGLSKNWFIIKEGLIPLLIGLLLFLISLYKKDYLNNIFINELMFDTAKVKIAISNEKQSEFEGLLIITGYYFIAGFFVSSIIQFILASIIVVSNPGDPSFNQEVSTMTWVSYIAILLPTMILIVSGFMKLVKGIEKITGMKQEEFLRI